MAALRTKSMHRKRLADSTPFAYMRWDRKDWLRLWLVFPVLLTFAGCGGDSPIPIEPKFTIDGQPLVDASITFIRTGGEQGRASFGSTDQDGIAKLTTYEPYDGVMPGKYSVVVVKAPESLTTFDVEAADLTDPEVMAKMSSMSVVPPPTDQKKRRRIKKRKRSVLPDVYADPGTTPLNCVVSSSGEPLVFDLKSESAEE